MAAIETPAPPMAGAHRATRDGNPRAARLMAMTPAERGRQPCIGADRADLVLAGAAILEAVQAAWPCQRVRVADRGLREGMLLSLMRPEPERRRRHRRRRRPIPAP